MLRWQGVMCLLEAQDGRCFYCNVPIYPRTKRNKRLRKVLLTRDHFIPRSRGGLDIWDNIVLACSPCNEAKGNRLPSYEEQRRFGFLHEELVYLQEKRIWESGYYSSIPTYAFSNVLWRRTRKEKRLFKDGGVDTRYHRKKMIPYKRRPKYPRRFYL